MKDNLVRTQMEPNVRWIVGFLSLIFSINIAACSDCDQESTGLKGRITSPNYPYHYPSNSRCTWIIKSPVNDREIVLKFKTLKLEPQALCHYDYLEIGTGSIPGENSLGKYCGLMKPRIPIKSVSGAMWLRFVSDAAKTFKGFRVTWKVKEAPRSQPFPNPAINGNECGVTNLNSNKGTIKSPRYPTKYPYNIECRWVIKAPNKNQVTIRFEYFDLEGASRCRFDSVSVRDGEYNDSTIIGRYCGTSKPATITTSSNVAYIHFSSDASITGGGFLIRWNTVDAENIGTTELTTIAPTVPGTCGGQFTSKDGHLESPSYPNFYPEDVECTWVISVEKPLRIRLVFDTEFDVEGGESCRYDFISIRDGAHATDEEIGKYCGIRRPDEPIISTTSSLYITFRSDKSTVGKGFSAKWTAIHYTVSTTTETILTTPTPTTSPECGGRLTHAAGVITSPGYPSMYPPNQNCVWLLTMQSGSQVRLNFDYLDLEVDVNCAYDYLLIRDGAHHQSPIIGRFCGPSAYISKGALYSSGKYLRIEFHSDSSNSKGGFRLSWRNISPSTLAPTAQTSEPTTLEPARHQIMTGCGGTFNLGLHSGTIFSPGYPTVYPPGLSCTWTVRVPEGNMVALSFNEFELEKSASCRSDYVLIKDGISEKSNVLGRYCGTKVPVYLMSTGNELSISFITNKVNHAKGFEISWMRHRPFLVTTVPTAASLKPRCLKESGTLIGEGPVSESNQCRWSLHAAEGNQIQLNFADFGFGNGSVSCEEDYIEILNGLTVHAPVIAKFCSGIKPYEITSTGRHVTVRYFMSGKFRTNFILNYKEIGNKKTDAEFTLNRGCGLSSTALDTRLDEKRRKNELGQWPWQAALIKKGMATVTCGGVLIAPQWVMGAAHCFKRRTAASQWLVKLGLVDLRSSAGSEQELTVASILLHPDYNSSSNENDIALIKLQQPAKLNKYVNTICLPDSHRHGLYQTGNTCHVAGWGLDQPLGEPVYPLTSMALPLVSKSECSNFADFVVTDRMLCAGYSDGIDTCQGDGGGALMCSSNGVFVAVGINSVGKGCGNVNYFGVYTDVRPYLDWIKIKLFV